MPVTSRRKTFSRIMYQRSHSRTAGCCNKVFLASFRTLRSVSFRAKRGILSFRSGQAPGEILFLLTSTCFKIPRSPSAPRNDSFPSFCNSLTGGNPETPECERRHTGCTIPAYSCTIDIGLHQLIEVDTYEFRRP